MPLLVTATIHTVTPSMDKPTMASKEVQTMHSFGTRERAGEAGGYYTGLDGYPREYPGTSAPSDAKKVWRWKWTSDTTWGWYLADKYRGSFVKSLNYRYI